MPLFTEFQPISKQEWLQKVEKDLKGKPLADLSWQLNEEITLTPFYHADDAVEAVGTIATGADNQWWIGQEFKVKDPKTTNTALLTALERGVNAPLFLLEEIDEEGLTQLFADVNLSMISLHFELDNCSLTLLQFLETFYQLAVRNNYDPQQLYGCLGLDPLINPTTNSQAEMAEAVRFVEKNLPLFRVFNIQNPADPGRPETVVEALTAQLHQGINYLEALQAEGIEPARVAARFQFSLEIGKSYFIEIAAIRAFKVLWANILKSYGCELYPIYLDAMLADHTYGTDQYTNMIRATTQAMSAVIGGVERLTIHPANSYRAQSEASDLTERVARNVQHILQMESHLDRVQDPAAGSYYIENLTNQLVEKVWAQL